MKEIALTRSQVALVDDEDFERISQYVWRVTIRPTTAYASKGQSCDGDFCYRHQLLIACPINHDIDHKDNNGLNNQKSNLRICSRSQNMANSGVRITNSSGFKGVTFCNQTRKWRAVVTVNYKTIHLGRFFSKEDAAKAYDKAAILHFGEFAYTNFK